MVFILAKEEDADRIAHFHADSWQKYYRGICTDQYLDYEVHDDRLAIWRERLSKNDPKCHTLIAENDEGKMLGFVCTFLDYHDEWGAYLDNLHVDSEYQGLGIGRKLMAEAAKWVASKDPSSKLYLHVLDGNLSARAFYEKIGGRLLGFGTVDFPWLKNGKIRDYIWDLDQLT